MKARKIPRSIGGTVENVEVTPRLKDENTLPKKHTQAYLILELIAVSGEVTADQISRLPGGARYKELVLIELRKRKLIYTLYRDGLRGLRLTANAKELLLADAPERFSFFLSGSTDSNILKIEITRRLRLHRVAQAFVTIMNADIAVFRDNKPTVFAPDNAAFNIDCPAFYSSREVKEIGERAIAVRGSRSVGVLLTDASVFAVYNMGDSMMKWDYRAEMRMKTLLKTLLCIERKSTCYAMNAVRGLVLADNTGLALQLMATTGSVKHNYFILDGNYDNFYFITNDRAGELVLKLLCDNEANEELRRVLSEDLHPRNPRSMFENDAMDDDGNPVVFAHTFDMPRIARFNSALQLHDRRGIIICLDFQADALRRYCCQNVNIQTVDSDKLERRFFREN